MIGIRRLALASLGTLVCFSVGYAGHWAPCGGCSDPCAATASCGGCGTAPCSGVDTSCGSPCDMPSEMLSESTKGYRIVMEPKYFTEVRAVCVTEMQEEKRYRTKKTYRTVPVEEERYRTKVVNVPTEETKTIKYSVLVAEKSEKEVEVTESEPVWKEIPEEYTVRVPKLVEVPDTYTVKVPKLKDQEFTYTVCVPQPVTEQRMKTVVNAVPVTKTRTVEVCVPKTTMKQVTKDYGCWQEQVVACGSGGASCGGCGSSFGCHRRCGRSTSCGGCGGTMTKKVWVPNVKTEMVPVTTEDIRCEEIKYTVYEQRSEQVPYECTKIVYQPETRTGVKKVVEYVEEERQRMRKVVEYTEEKRTRMRKELTYKTVTKKETIPHVTYKTEERSKDVTYTVNVPQHTTEAYTVTRYDQVCEEEIEEYTVCVPVTVTKEQKVQVCRMVPRLVEETMNPCADASSSCASDCGGCASEAGCSDCTSGCSDCGAATSGCGC